MTVHGLGGLARGSLAAMLLVSLSGCPEDDSNNTDDMAVDMAMMSGDMAVSADLSMATPATAQLVFADVVGTLWVPVPDGGVPYPLPTHVAAALATFPSKSGSQHTSGTTLHDCNWNRYNLETTTLTDKPIPDENAGTVAITGYSTAPRAVTAAGTPSATAPDSAIACGWGGATRPFYGCVFTPSMVSTDALAFPEFVAGTNFMPTGTSISEAFTANTASTYKDNIPATTLSSTPDWLLPKVTSVTAGGTNVGTTLGSIEGHFNGSADITIAYDCNGACPTTAGGLTGLLIETHLRNKWDNDTTDPTQLRRRRFGTAQCVDADFPGTPSRNFVLTAQMQKDILGMSATPAEANTSQTIRLVLVRLKAAQTFTGEHPIYLTAGKGQFALIEQK